MKSGDQDIRLPEMALFGPEAYATRSPSGHDLKTRSRPRLTDERPFGVGRPFGELENCRGLTREIVPADHYGSPLYIPDSNAEGEISLQQREL